MKMNHREASIIALSYKKKFLLILRDNKPDIISPNLWCFPGGVKEDNETFEETCKREVKEELNIKLTTVDFLVEILYESKRKFAYYSPLTEDHFTTIILSEGQKYDFFTIDEIKKLSLTPSSNILVNQYTNLLQDKLNENG